MAQTRKKRRRKHRGTQAGTVETFAHSSAKHSRTDARDARGGAQRARGPRELREPTWRGAAYKAGLAAVVFGVLLVVLFKRSVGVAGVWTVIVFFFYVPVGYWTDRAVYNRRKAKLESGKGKDGR